MSAREIDLQRLCKHCGVGREEHITLCKFSRYTQRTVEIPRACNLDANFSDLRELVEVLTFEPHDGAPLELAL